MNRLLKEISDYIWDYNACDEAARRSAWRHFIQIMAMIYHELKSGLLTLRAMSLVYTTLLSIVPILALSISVLKGFGLQQQLEPMLLQLLAPLGNEGAELSAHIVGFVENMKIGVLSALGLSLLVFTAFSLIHKIESAFNYTWHLHTSRNLVKRFSDYLSVILVGPILVISAFGISASLSSNEVVDAINSLPYMSDVVRYSGKVLPYALVIAAFTFIYVMVPNTKVRPRSALYGALVAGVLWQSSGILFASFVRGSTQYAAIYSGFAILLMFMVWLYLSWLILLIGASISYYHQNPERLKWKTKIIHLSARMREQLVLQAMVNIALAHDQRSDMVTSIENLAAYQQVPVDVLYRVLRALEADGLVAQSADDPPLFLPARAIQRIKLADILRSSRDAEEDSQADSFRSDEAVSELLDKLDREFELSLGDESLAEFLNRYVKKTSDENSLV